MTICQLGWHPVWGETIYWSISTKICVGAAVICLFIHYLYLLTIRCCWEAKTRWETWSFLFRSPITELTHRCRSIHTHSQLWAILMHYETFGRKLDNSEETHEGTDITCKLQTERPVLNSSPVSFAKHCTTMPPYPLPKLKHYLITVLTSITFHTFTFCPFD